MKTDIEGLKKLLRKIGCTAIHHREGRHYLLFFSYGGKQATPVTISRTPSDSNVIRRVATDIKLRLEELGAEPSQIGELKSRLPGVMYCITGRSVWMHMIRHRAWDDLEKLISEGEDAELMNTPDVAPETQGPTKDL
jgi:hypothetical protein